MSERVIGFGLLISGCVVGYLCIYSPLESAWSGEPSVSVSFKGAIFAPVGLIGLLYLVLGDRASEIMGTRDEPSRVSYVIAVGTVLLGIGIYIWLRSTLQSYGYEFEGLF